MSLDDLDGAFENAGLGLDDSDLHMDEPLNGIDSRRRIENRIEEMRLKKEVREFDFDL